MFLSTILIYYIQNNIKYLLLWTILYTYWTKVFILLDFFFALKLVLNLSDSGRGWEKLLEVKASKDIYISDKLMKENKRNGSQNQLLQLINPLLCVKHPKMCLEALF